MTIRNDNLGHHQYRAHRGGNRGHKNANFPHFCRSGFLFPFLYLPLPLDFRFPLGLFLLGPFLAVLGQRHTVPIAIERFEFLRKLPEGRYIRFVFGLFQPALVILLPPLAVLLINLLRFSVRSLNGGIIGLFQFFYPFCVCLLSILYLGRQLGKQGLFLPLQILRHGPGAEFFRPGQKLVVFPPAFFVLVLGLSIGDLRRIGAVKSIKLSNGFSVNVVGNGVLFYHLADMLCLFRDGSCFGFCLFVNPKALAHQGIYGTAALLSQGFAKIRLGVFGIVVQNVLKEAVGLCPVAVLQGHIAPVQQGGNLIIAAAADNDLFPRHGHRLLLGQNFFNAPQKVLHGPHLAHILGLQFGEFFGHIVGVDIFVAGNQVPGSVLCHEHQVPAPLVLDPHGVVILVVRANGQQDFGGVQGGEDIGFILLAQLVFQGDPGEEDPVALFRQSVVNVLGQDAVQGAVALVVGFLIADENIVGLLLGGNLNNALAQLLNLFGLLPVDLPGDHIGVFLGLVEVAVVQDAFKGRPVAGGDFPAGGRVVYVLNAIFAQHKTPVGLGLLGELCHDGFINPRRLVEFTGSTQPVGPGK